MIVRVSTLPILKRLLKLSWDSPLYHSRVLFIEGSAGELPSVSRVTLFPESLRDRSLGLRDLAMLKMRFHSPACHRMRSVPP